MSKACNVSVGANELEHSESGSFKRLLCSGCGHVLGRVYETTSRLKARRADMFTFDLDSVTSYKLGSASFDMLHGQGLDSIDGEDQGKFADARETAAALEAARADIDSLKQLSVSSAPLLFPLEVLTLRVGCDGN